MGRLRREEMRNLMANVEITSTGAANAASSTTASATHSNPSSKSTSVGVIDLSGTTTPAEPVLVELKRKWVDEGPKQEQLLKSICNHKNLKKSIGEATKRIKKEIMM